ncbi:MAG: hypothetical protein ACRD1E_13455, partial [Terriglobales bacterium]
YWFHRPARPSRRAAANSDCGAPLPKLHASALAAGKSAQFTTIEQLVRTAPGAEARVYRLQAALLQYRLQGSQYRLRLGSLVNPAVGLDALLPPGRCFANAEDGALLDELRQDFSLRFGALGGRAVQPAQPTQVVVTGVAASGPDGVQLRPVLDLHVQ